MKKILQKFTLLITSFSLIIIIADYAFPLLGPPPTFQMVQASADVSIHENHFGPYWKLPPQKSRVNSGCPNQNASIKIALLGSSILYGSGTDAEDSFAPKIREYLLEKNIDACVRNYAQPAGNFQTQLASFQDETEYFDLIIWELWSNSPSQFWAFNNELINFGIFLNREAPPDPFALGASNIFLLTYSNLYRAVHTQSLYSDGPIYKIWEKFVSFAAPQIRQEAQKHHSKILLLGFPAARNFESQREAHKKTYAYFAKEATSSNIHYLNITTELSEPHQQYFSDDCCHYNKKGTIDVANVIGKTIFSQGLLD